MKNRLFSFFLDLLFPAMCIGCRAEGSFLCKPCADQLRLIPPQCFVCKRLVPAQGETLAGRTCKACRKKTRIFAFFSPLLFQEPLTRELIHTMKYLRVRSLAEPLAEILDSAFAYYSVNIPEHAVLIPAPLHHSRLRSRGFNQSELIAKHFGVLRGLPVLANVLEKTKNTAPQVELGLEERQGNVRGVFAVRQLDAVRGKIVFLLDDVKTTGATLEAAASALKRAGARAVWAVTVAH